MRLGVKFTYLFILIITIPIVMFLSSNYPDLIDQFGNFFVVYAVIALVILIFSGRNVEK